MRAPTLALLGLAAVTALVGVACGRTGVEEPLEGPLDFDPTPRSPIPGPLGPEDFDAGRGIDGDLVLSGASFVAAVNTCHRLILGQGHSLTPTGTAALTVGRRVFVWQVQDSGAVSGDTSGAASVPPGDAGRWEIVEIVATNPILVEPALRFRYATEPGRAAQVCTVPEYEYVGVYDTSRIETPTWNGTSGGIVVLFASSAFELATNAYVRGEGDGFEGGLVQPNSIATDVVARSEEHTSE